MAWREDASFGVVRYRKIYNVDAPTNGTLGGAGTATAPATTATADTNFYEYRFKSTATSGDTRGIYNRLYLAGAGVSGESLRAFTTVDDVAAANAHGAHISVNFDSTANSGRVTGQAVAGRNTLHIPNDATWASGTISAINAEIWSDGANSDTDGCTLVSFLRFVNGGNASGVADVDDDAFLFTLEGGASGSGNVNHGCTLKTQIHGTTKYSLLSDSENRIDLSNINVDAANTDGGCIKLGTSASPVTEDTANMKFVSMYFDNGATSGDNRGMYMKLSLTGAGGGGEVARFYTDVLNVAAGTAHGAHISLGFGTTGSITGLGVANRNTLHIPAAMTNGSYYVNAQEIWADAAASDLAGATKKAFTLYNLGGDGTGAALIEDSINLFEIAGGSNASGNLVGAAGNEPTWTGNTYLIRCDLNGQAAYVVAVKV